MQRPTDPHDELALVAELVSGGIAALVAERIVHTEGEHMQTSPQAPTLAAPAALGASLSPGPVLHMLQGLQVAGILKGGIDLGVFDAIGAGHADASSIASAVGADERAMRILLDALAAVGILTGADGPGYGLSAESSWV